MAPSVRTIARFLEQPFGTDDRGWIAYRFGARVGAGLVVIDDDGLHSTLEVLYVSRKVRAQGIGTLLLDRCIKMARKVELVSLAARADERQTDLDQILRKNGFRRSKSKSSTDGFPEVWRSYELNLPLVDAATRD